MVMPRLIHPVPITVERYDMDAQVMDEDAREPIHGPRSSVANTVNMIAQVSWARMNDAQPEDGGVREGDAGYILCRSIDMDLYIGAGLRFKRGDRITRLGNLSSLDLYIVREQPMGHWPDQGGHTMTKYFFEDRHPVQQVGDL